MITFSALKEEWKNDEKYDREDAGNAALDSVKCQAKYANYLASERYALSQLTEKRKILRHDLTEYYLKRETPEVREKLGKKEGFGVKVLSKDVASWVDADPTMIAMNLSVAAQDEKVEYIKALIENLQNRNWGLKYYIEWRKFMAGVGGAS